MNPVVGLGLAQIEVQAVPGLQRTGLLIDENEEQRVFHRWQDALGATAGLPLAHLALQGLVRDQLVSLNPVITSSISRSSMGRFGREKLISGAGIRLCLISGGTCL